MSEPVPTETEGELLDTLDTVSGTETAHCRICDEPVISGADSWGEVLEALVEHGEAEHEFTEDGWQA